jgi:hypothetical protein
LPPDFSFSTAPGPGPSRPPAIPASTRPVAVSVPQLSFSRGLRARAAR